MKSWLLFFSSLPSKPVGNRVKVWRRLSRSGAVQLRGSAYVLPAGEEQREFFAWLAAEVTGMGGEAAFVVVDRVETVPDDEVIALFERRKSADYRRIEGDLEAVARRIENARQGGASAAGGWLAARLEKVRRDFDEARRTDFFSSATGRELEHRIASTGDALRALAGRVAAAPAPAVEPRSPEAYQGRRWVTRPAPFVDRMASAWLIRRCIDPGAVFGFIAGNGAVAAGAGEVVFDAAGGEFTHRGELCTFEVLLRSFGLRDAALDRLAEIVHDLDVREDGARHPETAGVGRVLEGIRRTARDDAEALERGMAVFEALYAARTDEH